MRCPRCNSLSSRVVDSRLTPREAATPRPGEWEDLGPPSNTQKPGEIAPQVVINKLRAGLDVALHRRPVPADAVEDFLRATELRIAERAGSEVSSSELGDWVMAFLRSVDTIAYVRFASVYRAFEDIGELLTEVAALAREDAAGESR